LGNRFAKLWLGETGSWSFPDCIPKPELGNEERKLFLMKSYVHVNPLKHGYVKRVADWPYSTFHRYVVNDIYPTDWCGNLNDSVAGDE